MATESQILDVPTFMGGYIMALCFSVLLYGITVAQIYLYAFNGYKNDTIILRAMVALVAILESAHTVFVLRQIYYLAVLGSGNNAIIQTFDWSTGGFFFAENGIVAVVDGFYIRRIWILSGKRILPTIGLTILLVVCIGFHMAAASYTIIIPTWAEFYQQFGSSLSVEVANTTSAALDGLIAASMIFLLHRSQTGYRRTDGILRWIIAYTVNTGLLTMIVSVSISITYSQLKGSILASGLSAIVSKLYANSFLGLLNARQFMRSRRYRSDPTSMFSTLDFAEPHYELSRLGPEDPHERRISFPPPTRTIVNKAKETFSTPSLSFGEARKAEIQMISESHVFQ